MKKLLFIIILLYSVPLLAQSKKDNAPLLVDSLLIGNWYAPESNTWTYGFFENFAIINGKPLAYEAILPTKKGYKIRFASSTGAKPLEVTMQKDALVVGKKKYLKVDRLLPNYAGIDTNSFYDSKFQSLDTAIISGYIRNNNSEAPFVVELRNWLNDEYERFYGDIDENGLYTVKVPLYNTSQAYIDWQRTFVLTTLTPGEHLFLYRDMATGENIIYGDNARFHNEIAKYNQYTSTHNIRPTSNDGWQKKYDYEKSLKDTAFLNLKLAQLDSLQEIDKEFIRLNNLSAKSLYYINNYNKFQIASDLMQKRFELDQRNGEKFSDDYMAVVKEQFYDNNITPLSLIRENSTFLTDYIGYKEYDIFPENVVYHSLIVNKLLDAGIIKIDGKLKNYFKGINLSEAERMNLAADDDISLVLQDSLVRKDYDNFIMENAALIEKYVLYDLYIGNAIKRYKAFLTDDLADLFITKTIFGKFNQSPDALDDNQLKAALASINSEFYRSLIKNKNNELIALANGQFKYSEHLKNTEHLKEAIDADKIIAEILSPHTGKVVYVDFWGTWCGPCVEEMAYAPAAKKAFEDKDVVFIYLANGTSKPAWENFIKSKDLEGKNVYHYNLPAAQQHMIERRLEVPHFPTYMLFNKEGNLVNKQAPRPSRLSDLKTEIDKLLLD